MPLIRHKEDDMFIAKLPTFEKRCETPAGMVEVHISGLLAKTNTSLLNGPDGWTVQSLALPWLQFSVLFVSFVFDILNLILTFVRISS